MRNDPLAPPRSTRVTLPFVLALASAATFLSAGSVALTRGSSDPVAAGRKPVAAARPVAIERLIPRDVAAFVRVTIDPSGPDEAALTALLRGIPGAARTQVLREFDRELATVLPISIDLAKVRRYLGEQIAVAVPVVRRRPQIVTILELRDAARASQQIRTTLTRGQTLVIDGDIGYAGPRRAIAALRASAKRASMADHQEYLRELGALGGDALAVAWFDGSRLRGVRDRDLPDVFAQPPTSIGEVPDFRRSRGVAVAYVAGDALVFEMRESGGLARTLTRGTAPMRLLGRAPSDSLVAIGLADPASYLRKILEMSTPRQGGFVPPGVDLERDLFSWLGDEVTIAILPDGDGFAGAITLKDPAAFERAFAKMLVFLRAQPGFSGDASGFTATSDGSTIAMRRGSGAIAIASSPDRNTAIEGAQKLVGGAGSSIADDPDYRRMFGDGPATMRMFFRARDGAALPGLVSSARFMRHVRAMGYEMRVDGGRTHSRVAISFAR